MIKRKLKKWNTKIKFKVVFSLNILLLFQLNLEGQTTELYNFFSAENEDKVYITNLLENKNTVVIDSIILFFNIKAQCFYIEGDTFFQTIVHQAWGNKGEPFKVFMLNIFKIDDSGLHLFKQTSYKTKNHFVNLEINEGKLLLTKFGSSKKVIHQKEYDLNDDNNHELQFVFERFFKT